MSRVSIPTEIGAKTVLDSKKMKRPVLTEKEGRAMLSPIFTYAYLVIKQYIEIKRQNTEEWDLLERKEDKEYVSYLPKHPGFGIGYVFNLSIEEEGEVTIPSTLLLELLLKLFPYEYAVSTIHLFERGENSYRSSVLPEHYSYIADIFKTHKSDIGGLSVSRFSRRCKFGDYNIIEPSSFDELLENYKTTEITKSSFRFSHLVEMQNTFNLYNFVYLIAVMHLSNIDFSFSEAIGKTKELEQEQINYFNTTLSVPEFVKTYFLTRMSNLDKRKLANYHNNTDDFYDVSYKSIESNVREFLNEKCTRHYSHFARHSPVSNHLKEIYDQYSPIYRRRRFDSWTFRVSPDYLSNLDEALRA